MRKYLRAGDVHEVAAPCSETRDDVDQVAPQCYLLRFIANVT